VIRINLLPVRAERKKESLRQQLLLGVGAILILAACLAVWRFKIEIDIDDHRDKVAHQKQEIIRLQGVIDQVTEFKRKKKELEDKIKVISSLEARQRGPVRMLRELAEIIPEKMWIESMNNSGGALSLSGVAIDNQTIAKFMTDMEKSPIFSSVQLQLTKQIVYKGGAALKQFSINASVSFEKEG